MKKLMMCAMALFMGFAFVSCDDDDDEVSDGVKQEDSTGGSSQGGYSPSISMTDLSGDWYEVHNAFSYFSALAAHDERAEEVREWLYRFFSDKFEVYHYNTARKRDELSGTFTLSFGGKNILIIDGTRYKCTFKDYDYDGRKLKWLTMTNEETGMCFLELVKER